MKLNAAQIGKVEEQLGAQVIPDEHPLTPDLNEAFGEHTFFLDAGGLNIVEPNAAAADETTGEVVRLARWESEQRAELVSHPPELLPVSVDLAADEADEPDPAA